MKLFTLGLLLAILLVPFWGLSQESFFSATVDQRGGFEGPVGQGLLASVLESPFQLETSVLDKQDLHGELDTGSDSARSEEALIIQGEISHAILKTSNGCGVGNYLIPATGDTSQGIPPILGALDYGFQSPWEFEFIDTIPGTQIKGVAFARDLWSQSSSLVSGGPTYPYVVVSDVGIHSYYVPLSYAPSFGGPVTYISSISIPGVTRMAKEFTTDWNDPIALYIEDSTDHFSIRGYDFPNLQEQFRFPIEVAPEIFVVAENGIYITGWDTSGTYTLYHYGTVLGQLQGTYPLNDSAGNALEFVKRGDSLVILSAPGDSMALVTLVDSSGGGFSQTVAYPHSDVRATFNEHRGFPKFTFQPEMDPNGGLLEDQILIFDPADNTLDTFTVDLELDYFKQPKEEFPGFGYFSVDWMGAKWEGAGADTVYIGDFQGLSKITTGAFPNYVNGTFGCWFSTLTELEKINFELYPNPTSDQVTINLIGLEKGRDYELEILDVKGRLYHTVTLQAYQKLQLPLESLAKGTYMLKLDTGKNVISKKLILQ